MGDEFYQRQPLLSGETGEEILAMDDYSPRARNGSAVKIDISDDREPTFPRERWKTVCSILFVIIGFLTTMTSLSVTHELRPSKTPPLPDIILDHVPYYTWALNVSEILIMVITTICAIVVICHKHRWILIRRICLIVGLLYFYRAITMLVTVLPSADPSYKCDPQLNHTITAGEVFHRVLKIMSGFGLTINGQHVYCGDFIFSGHTMILILCYLIISEYTPKKLWLVHWTSFLIGMGGVITLLLGKGHYSVDVIIAYFVTTRLWFMQHSVIYNLHLQQRAPTNHLARVWWWRIMVWFEKNVRYPLPNEFEIPRPWRLCWKSVAAKTRIRDPSRDI